MKYNLNKTLGAVSAALLLSACSSNIEVPVPGSGDVDATRYVAIGGTLSSGYADNALYYDAQLTAFPNLLAQQLKYIGGGEFRQPMVDAASVGIGAATNARFALKPASDCSGAVSLMPVPVAQTGDFGVFVPIPGRPGLFINNLSVPGLKSVTALYPGYGDNTKGSGNYNPFFFRFCTNAQTSSVLSDAASQQPTFFSLSLGMDDVLGFATTGGTQDAITPSSGGAGVGFSGSIAALVGTLTAGNAKGVLLNIPTLETLPFFTTVPYNGLVLNQSGADQLNAAYAPLGISFGAGANAFIIEDGNAAGGMRKIKEGEMILLSIPQDSIKCGGWGSAKPIPNQFVLTAQEIEVVHAAIADYNSVLKTIATEKNLAWVDVNAFMHGARKGIVYNGISMNSQFVSGGLFSLDGINLTPRGNALLTNEIIKAINASYNTTIPQVDAGKYRAVVFP